MCTKSCQKGSLYKWSGSPQRPWKTFAVILQACPRCLGISRGSCQSAGPNYMPTRHVKHIILQQTCSHGHFRSFIPKMKLFVKKASEKGEILQMSWITSTTVFLLLRVTTLKMKDFPKMSKNQESVKLQTLVTFFLIEQSK